MDDNRPAFWFIVCVVAMAFWLIAVSCKAMEAINNFLRSDAMGFEIGKKYRRRDGKIAKCIGIIDATDPFKRVCWESEGDFMRGTNEQGRGSDGSEKFDITYLEPIREPVRVTNHMRFLNVYPSGYICTHRTRCDADSEASFDRIGVYELPAEIEVTPAR